MSPTRTRSLVAGAILSAILSPGAAQEMRVDVGISSADDMRARVFIVRSGVVENRFHALWRSWRIRDVATDEKIARLAAKLSVTPAAVTRFLRILEARKVGDDDLFQKLAEVADRHVRFLDRPAVAPGDDPEIASWIQGARSAARSGNYEGADELLARAEEVAIAPRAARQARDSRKRHFITAAARRAERGELSLIRLRYGEAAGHFKAASQRLPRRQHDARALYLKRHGDALYRRGDDAALVQAIAAYRAALWEFTPARVPLDWAMTQNNLGNALARLGRRERGTERLEQSVDAYWLALEEHDRARAPLPWAMTQNNLGGALGLLGARRRSVDLLRQALAAVRRSYEVFGRNAVPAPAAFHVRDRIKSLAAALDEMKARDERARSLR